MSRDEQEIRQLVATWFDATRTGDTSAVLELMAHDVVFLRPGEPPMHKNDFANSARQQSKNKLQIAGSNEIHELRVFEDWAYMWSSIAITVTAPDASRPVKRSGDVLSIFNKQNGKWLLARDANMLVPVPDA